MNYNWGSRTLWVINPNFGVNIPRVWIIAEVKVCKTELPAHIPKSLPLNQVLEVKYWVSGVSEEPRVSICKSQKEGWADGPRNRFGFWCQGEGGDREDCNPCCSILHPELSNSPSSAHPLLFCLPGGLPSKHKPSAPPFPLLSLRVGSSLCWGTAWPLKELHRSIHHEYEDLKVCLILLSLGHQKPKIPAAQNMSVVAATAGPWEGIVEATWVFTSAASVLLSCVSIFYHWRIPLILIWFLFSNFVQFKAQPTLQQQQSHFSHRKLF